MFYIPSGETQPGVAGPGQLLQEEGEGGADGEAETNCRAEKARR